MKRYTDLTVMAHNGVIDLAVLENLPNCFQIMQPEFVEYFVEQSISFSFPVLETQLNPQKAMQGGFISAAFDNTFGILVYLVTKRNNTATIDMNINYHKPVYFGDKLTVTAHIKSLGKTIVHMYGEAYNLKKELAATAVTNFILLNN